MYRWAHRPLHDQWGFQEIDGTIYLNPSNFGEVHRPGGTVAEGGFFYSIDFQERQVSTVTLCKLVRGVVHEVVTYAPRNERWVEKISDPERFGALLRGKTHDCEGKSGFTIRSEIMNKMKWFFPRTAVRHLINEITENAGQAAFEIEKRYGASLSLNSSLRTTRNPRAEICPSTRSCTYGTRRCGPPRAKNTEAVCPPG